MAKRKQEEYKIQSEAVKYIRLAYPELLITTSPAGMIMSAGMAMKMIRMGYQSGTPDLIIMEARGGWFGLLIEVKTGTGDVSEEQRRFIHRAERENYVTRISRSVEEIIAAIEDYLVLPRTRTFEIPSVLGFCSGDVRSQRCKRPDGHVPTPQAPLTAPAAQKWESGGSKHTIE